MLVRHDRGTVTFLFTDIQGSTRLWEEAPGPMGFARATAAGRALTPEQAIDVVKAAVARARVPDA